MTNFFIHLGTGLVLGGMTACGWAAMDLMTGKPETNFLLVFFSSIPAAAMGSYVGSIR